MGKPSLAQQICKQNRGLAQCTHVFLETFKDSYLKQHQESSMECLVNSKLKINLKEFNGFPSETLLIRNHLINNTDIELHAPSKLYISQQLANS